MLKKRLAVFALAAMCLMLAALPQIMNKSLLFKKGKSYTLYAGSVSSNAQMIVCGEGKEFLTKLFTKEVTGESAAYDDKDAGVRRSGAARYPASSSRRARRASPIITAIPPASRAA